MGDEPINGTPAEVTWEGIVAERYAAAVTAIDDPDATDAEKWGALTDLSRVSAQAERQAWLYWSSK